LEARQEIRLENYVRKVQIESRLLGDLSLNQILPAALRYQGELVQSLRGMKDIGLNATDSVAYETVQEISQHLSVIKAKVNEMVEARKKANAMEHMRDMAVAYKDLKESYFQEIRYHVDKLELLVDDSYWPLAKYRELLFS
jgi:glutamine synthetase